MGAGNPGDHRIRKIRLMLPENATASAHMSSLTPNQPETLPFNSFGPAIQYMIDAAKRRFLFLDVMRQRGNQYREHLAENAPHVLEYEFELIVDGRRLERPVNYALVKIVPPANVKIDPKRRPFVVVDPRAGHGPGIGGFKADSEIGVAMRGGPPCYFIRFFPEPGPAQPIQEIGTA